MMGEGIRVCKTCGASFFAADGVGPYCSLHCQWVDVDVDVVDSEAFGRFFREVVGDEVEDDKGDQAGASSSAERGYV